MVKSNISILCVEDDSVARNFFKSFFEKRTSNFFEASDGEKGLEIFKKEQPNIVITDLDLPNLNGIEMIKKIREISKKVKIIIITAYNEQDYLLKATELNISHFLSKPIEIDILDRHVKELQQMVLLEKKEENNYRRVRSIIDSQPNIVVLTDGKKLIMSNKYFLDFLGYKNLDEFNKNHECICEFFEKDERYFYRKNSGWLQEIKEMTAQDKLIKVRIFNQVFLLKYSKTEYSDLEFVIILSDITALEKTKEKLQSYIKILNENIITSTTDKYGRITNVSEAFCRISGYTKEELIGKTHSIIRVAEVSKDIYRDMWDKLKNGKTWKGELKNKDRIGREYWVEGYIEPNFDRDTGEIIGYTAIQQDITDKKKVELLSITDGLTELYNRRFFNQKIKEEVGRARRENQYLSFIMFDVDFFKKYNDYYGHQAGDEVLQKVGLVIKKNCKRASDFAFRLGGEEFAILFNNSDQKHSLAFAEKIRKAIEGLKIEHEKSEASNYLTVSVGLFIAKGENIPNEKEIYKLADEALYEAKIYGRNKVFLQEPHHRFNE